MNCTQIQNADSRLGERSEAARCNEVGAKFSCFLMPIFVTSGTKLFILVRVSQPNSLSSNSKYVRFYCLATLEYSVFPLLLDTNLSGRGKLKRL